MDTNPLTVTAATRTTVTTPQNRNLRTAPTRLAVLKGWDLMMRGARKHCEEQNFVTVHNMPHLVGVAGACENTGLMNHDNVI
ncbi:MAG: hypothetical protein EOO56_21155 [Hymenobacter sp.]|nr:MAG: hypothetical protein EOO56_21155 [Hymenobacter sp.]